MACIAMKEAIRLYPNPLMAGLHSILLVIGGFGIYGSVWIASRTAGADHLSADVVIVLLFLAAFGVGFFCCMFRVLVLTPHFVRVHLTRKEISLRSLFGLRWRIAREDLAGYSISLYRSRVFSCEGIILYFCSGKRMELNCATIIAVRSCTTVLEAWQLPCLGEEASWHPLPKFKCKFD
jgi:hypothetical protein